MALEVILTSGRKLSISPAPFAAARGLYQAVADEVKDMPFDPNAEIDVNFMKGLFCAGIASKKIESCVTECMKRATYEGLKITNETWEPVEAREDYLEVCLEVAKENILPFMKSLYAKYSHILEMIKVSRA